MKLAHREQVSIVIDVDDVAEFDEDMAEAMVENTRRYMTLFSEAIYEVLPSYKEQEVAARDALDVYIEHRLLMEQRMRQPNENRDPRNRYPPELMRRL